MKRPSGFGSPSSEPEDNHEVAESGVEERAAAPIDLMSARQRAQRTRAGLDGSGEAENAEPSDVQSQRGSESAGAESSHADGFDRGRDRSSVSGPRQTRRDPAEPQEPDNAREENVGVDSGSGAPVGGRGAGRFFSFVGKRRQRSEPRSAADRPQARQVRREARRFVARGRGPGRWWARGVIAVGLVALLAVAVSYTPIFAVRSITVVGADRVSVDRVEAALSAQLGRPFPFVDEAEVKAALISFPLIETYQLEARPPSDLVVRIVERTPIGVVKSKSGFTVVDGAGVVVEVADDRPDDLPLIVAKGGTNGRGFGAASEVLRSLPADVAGRVVEISASSTDSVELTLDGGQSVAWGSAEESALKGRVLEALQKNFPDAKGYDVSSPDVPLTS
ncbi:MAG: FtsQ-type POTRA domain-containing protein [Mycetocola sp.]